MPRSVSVRVVIPGVFDEDEPTVHFPRFSSQAELDAYNRGLGLVLFGPSQSVESRPVLQLEDLVDGRAYLAGRVVYVDNTDERAEHRAEAKVLELNSASCVESSVASSSSASHVHVYTYFDLAQDLQQHLQTGESDSDSRSIRLQLGHATIVFAASASSPAAAARCHRAQDSEEAAASKNSNAPAAVASAASSTTSAASPSCTTAAIPLSTAYVVAANLEPELQDLETLLETTRLFRQHQAAIVQRLQQRQQQQEQAQQRHTRSRGSSSSRVSSSGCSGNVSGDGGGGGRFFFTTEQTVVPVLGSNVCLMGRKLDFAQKHGIGRVEPLGISLGTVFRPFSTVVAARALGSLLRRRF
jgi:hypothetical protein